MRSSHPPTLLKIAERTVVDDGVLAAGDLVMVAVSGGPDSMALLHVMAKLAPRLGIGLVAHGVDHGLREAAPDELALAARFAADLGVPFSASRVDVSAGPNVMARAREKRYGALREALRTAAPALRTRSQGARFIATGHHADDRAETVLQRILRGTGPRGLAVLSPRSNDLIRPFVRARRSDIRAHAERHRVPFVEDPTNGDSRFLRTRVRHEVLPLLVELSPRIVEHLCDLADAADELSTADAALVPAVVEGHALGRAQRSALARALRLGNSRARVPLPGGKIAAVDLTSRRIVLIRAE
ncbi:MAG TPA: tRNA lysidine(34) synthetase TilS [Polyangiaceae bacterium]|nr:tRNA lysidine(34) synthetase TilS [Polyangiaceae bacterium]